MTRRGRWIFVSSFLAFCWLAMQVAHEAGHILGALTTGGSIERVVLNPLEFSRTDLSRNPMPLLVAWAGPILGSLVPLAMTATTFKLRRWWKLLIVFFAGFCLLANGAYIGVGAFTHDGDAGDLLRHGAKAWHLLIFGGFACTTGLMILHRLGSRIGLARLESDTQAARNAPKVSLVLLFLLLLLEFAGIVLSA